MGKDELVKHFLEPVLKSGVDLALNKLFKSERFGTTHQIVEGIYAVGSADMAKDLPAFLKNIPDEVKLSKKWQKARYAGILIFYVKNVPVGYFIPTWEASGYVRPGTVVIFPKYQSKGYGTVFMKMCFKGNKGKVLIAADNEASMKMYTAAGFHRTGHYLYLEGDRYYEYRKDNED
jgi:GNAT superfamily N-acetyltransferase